MHVDTTEGLVLMYRLNKKSLKIFAAAGLVSLVSCADLTMLRTREIKTVEQEVQLEPKF